LPLRIEGIGPLDCEAGLADLWRIRRGEAGELRPIVKDDVEIAVRAVVISQANIGADRLDIRRVHLKEAAERQKRVKE